MLGIIGITYASGVPTIIGAEENIEATSVISSQQISCLYIEQAA